MDDDVKYGREAALAACLVAWLIGVGCGVFLALAYRPPAPESDADTRMTTVTLRRPPVTRPTPYVPPTEWRARTYVQAQRLCPRIQVEEIRIYEGDIRKVVMSAQLSNNSPDRACTLARDDLVIRDGDGNSYRFDEPDAEVAALGAKRAHFTFSVPRSAELVQLVATDDSGRASASVLDLAPPRNR